MNNGFEYFAKKAVQSAYVIIVSVLLPVSTWQLYAQDENSISGDYMTGDFRQSLADKGVMLEMVYTGETDYNASGGLKQDSVYLSNIDTTLDMDMETLMGWNGGQIFLYGLGGYGDAPSELAGDIQASSNIEHGMRYYKLYEAWVQQTLADGKFSVLFGMHDLNSEFYVNDPAGLFLNSSMGIGTEIAQSGVNGPSIFPVAAPALRLKVAPTDAFYVIGGVYNAVSGDPTNPAATDADFTFYEGALMIAEAGIYTEGEMKLALGGWGYSQPEPSLKTGNDSTPYGVYLLADKTFGDISLFFRAGMANEEVFAVSYNIMEGIVFSGAMWNREDDQFGIGASTILAGGPVSDAVKALGGKLDSHETAIEVTYLLQINPWFSLQPNFQYIMNPGFDNSVDDASMFALRGTLSF